MDFFDEKNLFGPGVSNNNIDFEGQALVEGIYAGNKVIGYRPMSFVSKPLSGGKYSIFPVTTNCVYVGKLWYANDTEGILQLAVNGATVGFQPAFVQYAIFDNITADNAGPPATMNSAVVFIGTEYTINGKGVLAISPPPPSPAPVEPDFTLGFVLPIDGNYGTALPAFGTYNDGVPNIVYGNPAESSFLIMCYARYAAGVPSFTQLRVVVLDSSSAIIYTGAWQTLFNGVPLGWKTSDLSAAIDPADNAQPGLDLGVTYKFQVTNNGGTTVVDVPSDGPVNIVDPGTGDTVSQVSNGFNGFNAFCYTEASSSTVEYFKAGAPNGIYFWFARNLANLDTYCGGLVFQVGGSAANMGMIVKNGGTSTFQASTTSGAHDQVLDGATVVSGQTMGGFTFTTGEGLFYSSRMNFLRYDTKALLFDFNAALASLGYNNDYFSFLDLAT